APNVAARALAGRAAAAISASAMARRRGVGGMGGRCEVRGDLNIERDRCGEGDAGHASARPASAVSLGRLLGVGLVLGRGLLRTVALVLVDDLLLLVGCLLVAGRLLARGGAGRAHVADLGGGVGADR